MTKHDIVSSPVPQNNKNLILQEFLNRGYVAPLDLLTTQEAMYYRECLLSYLNTIEWNLTSSTRHKPHLFLKWANDLARHPLLMDYVTSLLGPNVILWYSVIFVKKAHSIGHIPWHQDSTYWAMNNNQGLTAWIALSEVNQQNGCIEFYCKHRDGDAYDQTVASDPSSILARGQELLNFSSANTSFVELKTGQLSIHNTHIPHRSGPNNSDNDRLGIAFRYIPTTTFPITLKWLRRTATVVTGNDEHKHFLPDYVPNTDFDPKGIRAHKWSLIKATIHTLFGDTQRSGVRKFIDLFKTSRVQIYQYLKLSSRSKDTSQSDINIG